MHKITVTALVALANLATMFTEQSVYAKTPLQMLQESLSIYYKEFNSGWTGQYDVLTLVLNAVGGDIAQGEPLSYNWLCGGLEQKNLGPEAFSDPEHYMGFLKCYYTVGMVGGVAGYFSYPPGGFEADLADQVLSWLQQMVTMEVDPTNVQFLFQGASDSEYRGNAYGKIPWRLGLLEMIQHPTPR